MKKRIVGVRLTGGLCAGLALLVGLSLVSALYAAEKPPLTLDDFFNSVEITSVRLAPDGKSTVIATSRADWKQNRFRTDLWLYRDGRDLAPLTQSGHDTKPEWSPDGRWIAFLSDRDSGGLTPEDADPIEPESEDRALEEKALNQVWVIAADGGEAFQITHGKEGVHAFAWSADSRLIYFSTRTPWTHQQEESYRKEWKDVIRFRESERGDTLFSVDLPAALGQLAAQQDPAVESRAVATTPWLVKELSAAPDGRHLAFSTDSPSERQESLDAYNLELVDLPSGATHLLSHTQAIYENVTWSPDSQRVLFSYLNGSVEGAYEDLQPRIYSVAIADTSTPAGAPLQAYTRRAAKFEGAPSDFAVLPDSSLFLAGRLGTEVQPYAEHHSSSKLERRPAWPGTYETLATATRSNRVAFVYSSLEQPTEVYLAESLDHLDQARPITCFNRPLADRALPEGRPYRWKADDGASVEGMLIYPPGKFGAEHLPMFTFIHGGPQDADGNHFEADWYQWAALAATDGWLVFEPNYRGSIGYGDAFALGIIPHIVSRPGKDILEGIDQLVHDGIADPGHLSVGGYSYGGYLTNWLITQTTRFKAAVSGAGAVEHVANWGNDDTTQDDAYFLGGLPWEAQKNYEAEAAIWQFDKVTTPTHVVAGSEDIRVYVGENYLLERALKARGVPASLLIFPGEGHELDKNPWHGKIKVREELKWLDNYGKP